ncbi:hypothetical protein G6734_08715, partial [Polynucleobacter paneuropaeus]|nr:hypothetical protein [Polynucleobacter paneuropaeus]
ATYLVAAGHSGSADVAIIAHDSAGNTTGYSATSTITIDTVAPTVVQISQTSNNNVSTLAQPGDVIIETFFATDAVTSVTIGANSTSLVSDISGNYTASYTVSQSDLSGPANVMVNAIDIAGNETHQLITTTISIDVKPIVTEEYGIITVTSFTANSKGQISFDEGATWGPDFTGQTIYLTANGSVIIRQHFGGDNYSLPSDPRLVNDVPLIQLAGNALYVGSNSYQVFLGSSGDDRAIGNNGHDVFKDFNAGDSFVGNAQTTIQIAQ